MVSRSIARSRHAATCAETLSQLDHVTQEDGNDEFDDDLIALVDEIDRKRELEAGEKGVSSHNVGLSVGDSGWRNRRALAPSHWLRAVLPSFVRQGRIARRRNRKGVFSDGFDVRWR